MSNIGSLLKSEIARVARREIRAELTAVKRASAAYRHTIADLKRKISVLEKRATQLERQPKSMVPAGDSSPDANRFQARGFKSLRERLGLSAEKMGKLLGGVSALSVYAWEAGRNKPRKENVAAIAALRTLGKREAEARLSAAPNKSKRKPKASASNKRVVAQRSRVIRAKRK